MIAARQEIDEDIPKAVQPTTNYSVDLNITKPTRKNKKLLRAIAIAQQ